MPKKKTSKPLKSKVDERTEENLIMDSQKSSTFSSEILRRPAIIFAVVLLVLFGLLYFFKGLLVAAVVNGQPISRLSIIQETEKQAGKQTLNSLVTKALILQEAKKQGVKTEKTEIDAELKKIEDSIAKQGQNIDTLLQTQGMTRKDIIDQIELQKTIEKLVGKDITVTDKEVDEFIQKNKDSLSENESSQTSRDNIKQQLKQEKMSQKFRSFVADLEKKAKIYRFVNY